jgi:hypothetical protein
VARAGGGGGVGLAGIELLPAGREVVLLMVPRLLPAAHRSDDGTVGLGNSVVE